LHGDGFLYLYDAARYYALCRGLVERAYPGSRFYSPVEYQPGVIGQRRQGGPLVRVLGALFSRRGNTQLAMRVCGDDSGRVRERRSACAGANGTG
jgi:hypothetical protein